MSIKLIIWDLDDTFWSGNFLQKNVKINEKYINFLKETTLQYGIIHSICSHNDYNLIKNFLEENDIFEYFIYPKISYNPKGPSILNIIKSLGFREEETLFIDDNIRNLEEAKVFCPKINILEAKDLVIENINISKLQNTERFKQYKIIESKLENKIYDNYIEFLEKSNIHVFIKDIGMDNLDRVEELINRSNQLNYTKNRASKESLENLGANNNLVIYVYDNFGYYGICGFVSYNESTVLHFVFSCRVLNMGIESFIFNHFHLPQFDYNGEVAYPISSVTPHWIKISRNFLEPVVENRKDILFIGGCDLQLTKHYISESRIYTYFNDADVENKKIIVHRDSIDYLLSRHLNDLDKNFVIKTCPFVNSSVFALPDFLNFDYIVYSPLIDYAEGKYKSEKIKDFYLSCHDDYHDSITDELFNYMLENYGVGIGEQKYFLNNWKCVKKMDEEYLSQLKSLFNVFGHCKKAIVLLGATNTFSSLDCDKFEIHKKYNLLIRKASQTFNNIEFVEVDDFISRREDFTNSIRHYNNHIYYNIAQKICNILEIKIS